MNYLAAIAFAALAAACSVKETPVLPESPEGKVVTLVANTCDYRRTYGLKKDAVDLLTSKPLKKGRLLVDPNTVYIFEE